MIQDRHRGGSAVGARKSTAKLIGLVCALVLSAWAAASAHEVRPAYLELREERPDEFSVLFKTPMRGDARLSLTAELSGPVEALTPVVGRATGAAMVQTWRLRAVEPLAGQTVTIDGLTSTMTDALVRIEFMDGSTFVERLTPRKPEATIPADQTAWLVSIAYLELGVEHILLGFDHLLFVLALFIIATGFWKVVKTVTAFTAAHSITLALATLGVVHVPSPPVEAAIALSIAFVAVEIVRVRRGRPSFAARAPWLVAFAFGLLHGLGFAGALSEVGLPPGHIPAALLFFNLGVEIGQLIFLAAVAAIAALVRIARPWRQRWPELVPPYAIGAIAMFWVIERVAAF
jgi:hydrogenase/urease accessory protein HupE